MTFREYLDVLRGKRVAVLGAGVSNTPPIEALLEAGVDTAVCDMGSREKIGDAAGRYEALGAKLRLGESYLDDLDADVIFRTPGIMPSNPAIMDAVGRGAQLTSEMEVFFEVCPCRIIAVTGSDGKTTTTSIIADMLKNDGYTVHVGGNIGAPLLCKADDMRPDDIAVVELSSFQLMTMQNSPDIAVITNVAPNHLDVHKDMDEYIGAKRNIYMHQSSGGKAVFNYDNDLTRAYADTARGEAVFFSSRSAVGNGCYLSGGTIYEAADGASEPLIRADEIFLPGAHNAENFMAAFAALRGLAGRDAMLKTARTFKGVAHRIEFVRELRGVRYYNDSIASSPSRTIAGLRSFDRKVILIAGGKDKGVAFDTLGVEITSRVKKLILTGLTAEKIRDAVSSAAACTQDRTELPEIKMIENFEDAVLAASNAAGEGDIVMLSPACTSFDRFKNFEERGNLFKKIVEEME